MNREILTNPHKTKAVISIARRLLALLSSIGVAISLVIYVASFGALTLDRMGNWIFVPSYRHLLSFDRYVCN